MMPPAASTAQTATLAGQAPTPTALEWEAKLIFGPPFSPPVWLKSVVTATSANTVEATSTVASPGLRSQPTVPTLSAAEIAGLLARGDWLFATGDVASARLLYERAADAGEARAAVRLGETFDPVAVGGFRHDRRALTPPRIPDAEMIMPAGKRDSRGRCWCYRCHPPPTSVAGTSGGA